MIVSLHGRLVEALPTHAILDVQGVGYEVLIPVSTFEKLPLPGQPVTLLTHLQIREDAHALFGFFTAEERDLFRLLVANVSGVGPKLALSFLNGCSPSQFRSAVIHGDAAFLSKIKGVGKKTAERVVLELKDKVGVSQVWASASQAAALPPEQQRQNDALLALIALGYKQPDALKALQAAGPQESVEASVREALKRI
jgi:Holliday junction DNA helicase RuvA